MAVFSRRISLFISALLFVTSILSIVISLVFVYEVDDKKFESHERTLLTMIEVINWFFASVFALSIFGVMYILR
jgi:hypothetical protein